MKKEYVITLMSLLILMFFGIENTAGQESLEATIESIKGEVETKFQKVGSWEPARIGTVLRKGDSLSTGFDSEALLVFADNSRVTVDSLTMLTINEFFREGIKVRTDLAMKVGGVRAKIKRGPDVISDFVVTTPTSVVSVRGTDEEVIESDMGTRVNIYEGSVTASNVLKQSVLIAARQKSRIFGKERPTSPVVEASDDAKADTTTAVGLTDKEVQADKDYTDTTSEPGSIVKGQKSPYPHPHPCPLPQESGQRLAYPEWP